MFFIKLVGWENITNSGIRSIHWVGKIVIQQSNKLNVSLVSKETSATKRSKSRQYVINLTKAWIKYDKN